VRLVPSAQLTLLGSESLGFDSSFATLRRVTLANGAWIEHAPSWLRGHGELFDGLARTSRWQSGKSELYGKLVQVPRLFAALPDDGPGHPVLEAVRRALSRHYGQEFVRVTLAYYRDGRDSVAWHGDQVARRMQHSLMATVSIGAPRKFLLRPYGGGRSIALSLGWGDLLVMGGTIQRTWQHSVPKLARAEPRIAIMFRPPWEID
jgi:alkylated DNA repair dioxygenase AlkB